LVCRKSAKPALAAFAAIAKRMDLTLNRDKTRETRLTEGFDFLGVGFVKRRSPTTGKPAIYLSPAKSAQQVIRDKLKSRTSRRAPISPQDFVALVNPLMMGCTLLPSHQRQPRLPGTAALRQHSLSSLPHPTK